MTIRFGQGLLHALFFKNLRYIVAALLISLFGCMQITDEENRNHNSGIHYALSTVPSQFSDAQILSGLSEPVSMTFAADGRLFICEKGGRIRLYKNGNLLASPFLATAVDPSGERGMLGMAFDPNFATEKFVYVYYTTASGGNHNRVSRFTVSNTNPDTVLAGSELVLLELTLLGSSGIHNGGGVHFGKDGKLYIATGENANGPNAQDMNSMLGKILRINKDGSIPTDNPFLSTTTGKNQSIWALGLRNPFTFAFQNSTGRLFINDVGDQTWEELNEGVKGANYGWPAAEGKVSNPAYKDPYYFYDHKEGCSIIGGDFYEPATQQFPSSYYGHYFFADYCSGWIRDLNPATNTLSDFSTGAVQPVDIKVSPDGAIYYLSITGTLRKISYTGSLAPAISDAPKSLIVGIGKSATFTVVASGGLPLNYQWQKNGVNISGATAASYTLPSPQLADNNTQYLAIVQNTFGTSTSTAATLTVVDDLPPTLAFTSPALNSTYSGGQTINYSATGNDPEDGVLPATAFTWLVKFWHEGAFLHPHTFLNATGSKSGSFVVPTSGEPSDRVFFRIYLTVIDSKGLTKIDSIDVLPVKATVSLITSPVGLKLKLDGTAFTAPTSFIGVAGIERTLEAITPQLLNGQYYIFSNWSDGGAFTHTYITPSSNTNVTANFIPYVPDPNEKTLTSATTPVVASSSKGGNTPNLALDGNASTRWESNYVGKTSADADAEWIYVDLGSPKKITSVSINWEGAYAQEYDLQVSNDAVTWTLLKAVRDAIGGQELHVTLNGIGRYVRMKGILRYTIYGYSIYEFKVLGMDITTTNFSVTPSVAAGQGSVSPNSAQTIAAGGSTSFTATPTSGFHFDHWTVNGTATTSSLTAASLTLSAINSNVTVQATFLADVVNEILLTTTSTPGFASSSTGTNLPKLVVDGITNTRWESNFSGKTAVDADSEWVYLDLGASKNITHVNIVWEGAYGKDYDLQTSTDAVTWTLLKAVRGGLGGTENHTGLNGTGRYLRMKGIKRGTGWGYSIFELKVYGPTGTVTNYSVTPSVAAGQGSISPNSVQTIAAGGSTSFTATATSGNHFDHWTVNGTVTASSLTAAALTLSAINSNVTAQATFLVDVVNPIEVLLTTTNTPGFASSSLGTNLPKLIVDGIANTRWESNYSGKAAVDADSEWVYLDLGASKNITRINIIWEGAYGKDFDLQSSPDATAWTLLKAVRGGIGGTENHTGLIGTGRYVRMKGIKRGTGWGYSIFELKVYGN